MNKAQYDDVYVMWLEGEVFLEFNNCEDEEAYARRLRRIYH